MRFLSLVVSLAVIAVLNGVFMSRVEPSIHPSFIWAMALALGFHGAICAATTYAALNIGRALFLIPFSLQSLAPLLVLAHFPDGNASLIRAVLTMGLAGASCGALIALTFYLSARSTPVRGQSIYRD